jgi:hypothetical protein
LFQNKLKYNRLEFLLEKTFLMRLFFVLDIIYSYLHPNMSRVTREPYVLLGFAYFPKLPFNKNNHKINIYQ